GVLDGVEDGPPGGAGVGGLQHTARGETGVERAGLTDHARDGGDAAAAKRADVAPDQSAEELGFDGRRRDGDRGEEEADEGDARAVHWDTNGIVRGARKGTHCALT